MCVCVCLVYHIRQSDELNITRGRQASGTTANGLLFAFADYLNLDNLPNIHSQQLTMQNAHNRTKNYFIYLNIDSYT